MKADPIFPNGPLANEMSHADPIMFQNLAATLSEYGKSVEAYRQAQDRHDRETWANTFPGQPYPFGKPA